MVRGPNQTTDVSSRRNSRGRSPLESEEKLLGSTFVVVKRDVSQDPTRDHCLLSLGWGPEPYDSSRGGREKRGR